MNNNKLKKKIELKNSIQLFDGTYPSSKPSRTKQVTSWD